ncbi:MAG: hypothetical protein II069_02650, partial [Oscillospiraceae bacterium]|nr:hypothetical protein [Oscillospiraceae bacterium]
MAATKTPVQTEDRPAQKKEISLEAFIFIALFVGFFGVFAWKMGMVNAMNTMMNTAYKLLTDTVLYLTAICVLMGAVSALLSEFGVVSLTNRLLRPLMQPVYGLPGAASLGIVTTFLSDNPVILTLADDKYFRSFFKKYQFPALTNLGTSFGMGMIVCTFMLGLSAKSGGDFGLAVLVGLLGAVVGSIVSTRLMLHFTRKTYGTEENMDDAAGNMSGIGKNMRPVRPGSVGSRLMAAMLEGGASGVKMGVSIIPGVLIICTVVMMLTNGPGEGGVYTGAEYEGIGLLPWLADKLSFILKPLFGFSSPEAVGVPITALGAAGAAIGVAEKLVEAGKAGAGDVAVFTAMCMCWSGYLSTHVSMMNSLHCEKLISKA